MRATHPAGRTTDKLEWAGMHTQLRGHSCAASLHSWRLLLAPAFWSGLATETCGALAFRSRRAAQRILPSPTRWAGQQAGCRLERYYEYETGKWLGPARSGFKQVGQSEGKRSLSLSELVKIIRVPAGPR